MTDFQTVAQVGDIPEGKGEAFAVNGRMVAVFCEGGEYFAIDDMCPHMGASLAGGIVEEGVVACPWHLWRFCIRDGAWRDNPKIAIDRFELRIQGSDIQVLVPDPPPRPTRTDTSDSGNNDASSCQSCESDSATNSKSALQKEDQGGRDTSVRNEQIGNDQTGNHQTGNHQTGNDPIGNDAAADSGKEA